MTNDEIKKVWHNNVTFDLLQDDWHEVLTFARTLLGANQARKDGNAGMGRNRLVGEALMVARAAIQGVLWNPPASIAEREKSLGVALNAIGEIEQLLMEPTASEAAMRDKVLEEAAQACEKRSEREAYGHAKAACWLDAEAIRDLKSATTQQGVGDD